jgi:hypothetical protein
MTENTRDLSKFGLREIGIAAELLTKYADGRSSWASAEDELSRDIAVEFNPNSGEVFLVDEDYRVAMVNDNRKLENWVNCFNCGAGGFRSELPLDGDGNCAKCKGK